MKPVPDRCFRFVCVFLDNNPKFRAADDHSSDLRSSVRSKPCKRYLLKRSNLRKWKKLFWTMIKTTKIVPFLHPCVRVFEYRSWNTHSYFRKAKIFKIPFSQLPDFLFTPHQLSVHLRQEAIHYWKHLTGQHQLRFFPSTQNSSVKSWCAHFFPHLANIWRWHIELLLLHVSNSSSFCFLEYTPINFTSRRMNPF